MKKEEVKKLPAQEQIAASIRAGIERGELLPGMELKQVELAARYGVSRMPVREALKQLLAEGVVEKLDNRHIIVAGTDEGGLENTQKSGREDVELPRIRLLPARDRSYAGRSGKGPSLPWRGRRNRWASLPCPCGKPCSSWRGRVSCCCVPTKAP